MSSNCCIWCLEPTDEGHEEHIIPEAIGCPPGFVLPSTVVCRSCNNGLSDLDQAVIDEFDFPAFMAGVPRKKGKSPVIRSRGNVLATVEPSGPTYTFNMDPIPHKAHDGSRLAPYRGSKRDIRGKLSKQGNTVTINFDIAFGQNRKFLRGITKIAFSSLAYFLGAPLARSATFTSIRRFVKDGIGDRHLLLTFNENDINYSNRVWAPYVSPSGEYAVTLRIAYVEFLIDLSSEESLLSTFQSKASEIFGEKKWCILPTKTSRGI